MTTNSKKHNYEYFIDVISFIDKDCEVPYYIDSKIRDLSKSLTIKEIGIILKEILSSERSSNIFRYFSKNKILFDLCFYLDALKKVPQNKRKSKNAYEHTLRVIETVPVSNIALRWCALMHDFGKLLSHEEKEPFYYHSLYSYKMAKILTGIYNVESEDRILNIIKNHMIPFAFLKDKEINDDNLSWLIKKINNEYLLETIEFAIYDKKAENDYEKYIIPLEDLYVKVKEKLYVK